MPLSRTDYKEAMQMIVEAGVKAKELTLLDAWRRLPAVENRAFSVLAKVVSAGLDARDVLDQMEENDE